MNNLLIEIPLTYLLPDVDDEDFPLESRAISSLVLSLFDLGECDSPVLARTEGGPLESLVARKIVDFAIFWPLHSGTVLPSSQGENFRR